MPAGAVNNTTAPPAWPGHLEPVRGAHSSADFERSCAELGCMQVQRASVPLIPALARSCYGAWSSGMRHRHAALCAQR
jgi:hypothetical protein